MTKQKEKGYTLVEIIIVLAIIGIVTTAITISISSASTIRVEGIVTQVRASIANVRREAVKGTNDPNINTFSLANIYGANPPLGIRISPTSSSDQSTASCQCADNLKSLCLTDQTFCYEASDGGDGKDVTFTFEAGSGRLNNNHAIFIAKFI